MKKRIAALLLILTIFIGVMPAQAAGNVIFTVVDEDLKELSDATMPFVENGEIYIPHTALTENSLGIFFMENESVGQVMLYSNTRYLVFDVNGGYAFDLDGIRYESAGVMYRNGTVYVPARFTCSYFRLGCIYMNTGYGYMVRIKTPGVRLTDKQFINAAKGELQAALDAYNYVPPAEPSEPDEPDVPVVPTEPEKPTYERVTVFLNITGAGENMDAALEVLERYGEKACFFFAGDEIAEHAAQIRKVSGYGHTVGIYLRDGTLEEYRNTSALLFEATRLRTVLVLTGNPDEELMDSDLVLWSSARMWTGSDSVSRVNSYIKKTSGSRNSLVFSCDEKTGRLLTDLLGFLSEGKFNIEQIVETTAAIRDIWEE